MLVYHNPLFLADPPNVHITEPQKQIVNQNQKATFICTACGNPVPNITWVKIIDESIIQYSKDAIQITEIIINNTDCRRSVLTFLHTSLNDESVYRCEGTNNVTNVIQSPMSDTVSLTVLGEFVVP